jgi:hypothetical protein
MKEILRERFLAHYYQIALLDAEGPGSYPEWITGEEAAVIGPKGVIIATPSDKYIETIIITAEKFNEENEIISGEIIIGSRGLLVGNVTSASYRIIPWPPGKIFVKAFLVQREGGDVQVIFYIDNKN